MNAEFPIERAPHKAANAVIHAGFVVTGVMTTLLGPILPVLIHRWNLSDAQAGLFFSAQYFAALTGALTLSALLVWRGYRIVLGAGFAFMAVGIATLLQGNHVTGLVSTVIYGYGLGLILSSVNLWVAEVAGPRRAAASLSMVNVAWGVGAVSCPAMVLLAQKADAVPGMLLGIGALAGAAAVTLASMDVEPETKTAESPKAKESASVAGKTAAIVIGSFFFLYVGAESSVGGWIAALAKRMGTTPGNLWALAPMFFWGGLITGRMLAPMVLRRVREERVLAVGLIAGALGNTALVAARSFAGAAVCGVAIGLGFAAIYPILVAGLLKCFGARARRISSAMFALASLGGALMPWLVGVISTREGGLRAGLLAPLGSCVVMIALMPLLRRRAFS